MSSEAFSHGALVGRRSVSTLASGTVYASPGWNVRPSMRKPTFATLGQEGLITAWSSPNTLTSKPAASNESPLPTAWTFAPIPSSCPASAKVVQISSCGVRSATILKRSMSTWSGCSCVMSTASAPSRASGSVSVPGSITNVCPPFSRRTHACPIFVNRIDRFLGPGSGEPLLEWRSCLQHGEITGEDAARGVSHGIDRDPREATTDADPLRPRVDDLGHRHPPEREHVDRLRHRRAHSPDLLAGPEPWCEQHVRPGGFERLEARDRVVEIGFATDVVLGSRRQRERERESVRRLS